VLFEVHATSNYRFFVDDVLARADELRRRYAQCGCSFALTTLLRCAQTPRSLPGHATLTWHCARAGSPRSRQ